MTPNRRDGYKPHDRESKLMDRGNHIESPIKADETDTTTTLLLTRLRLSR